MSRFRFSPRTNRAHEVHWREWGEAAFEEAQQQDKLVVVVLTAFWCGYCQRMDETSLSHDEVRALLNAFFIPIRVEESQRPDVDLRYNQNGWPTIAFLTPGGDPLFSVNYTAPEPLIHLLVKLVDAYQRDQAAILADGAHHRAKAVAEQPTLPPARLTAEIVAEIVGMVEGLADPTHGGYGTHFKFLHPDANDFLLYLCEGAGDVSHLDHVRLTLEKMHQSATFDAQDGGFFRYSSTPDWQEPHPEKLLDDQAALLQTYVRTYLLTDSSVFRDTAEGLIDYLDTTLGRKTDPCLNGCQDYVRPAFDVSVPQTGPLRPMSLIDDYVYCDANARAVSAYLEAWWLLGRADCRTRARAILEHLWASLRAPGGGMYHYADDGPHVPGLLLDSVRMGLALLDAYRVNGNRRDVDRARALADEIVCQHRRSAGGFSDIRETGPGSLETPVAVLTQNATTARFFVQLADLSGEIAYRKMAHWALKCFPHTHRHHEAFAAEFGHALSRLLALPLHVIIRGTPGAPRVRELARAALSQLRHGDLVLHFQEDVMADTASVVIRFGEQQFGPITDPADLSPALAD